DGRRLLVGAYAAMALVELLAAGSAWLGLLDLWQISLVAFAAGTFWCVDIPVRRTLLAEAGGQERVAVTMGLEMVTTHLTRTLGPAVGGVLLATAGMPGVFALGAALYLAGAVVIAGTAPTPPRAPAAGRGFLADLAEGVALVRAEPRLLAIVALTLNFNLWGLPYLGLVPVLAAGRYGLGPVGTGLLAAAEGVGAVLGAALVLALARPAWFGPVLGLGCALFFAAEILFALAPGPGGAGAALLVAGLGMAGFSAMQTVLPLAVVPAGLRVRVMGVVLVSIGSAPLGFLLAGALGDRLGAGPAVGLMGGIGLATTALCLWHWPVAARAAPVATTPD
ncbi:MAG TPA: MFS transporter, partial [Geminicoccaceae bacterium]